jgi:hypothetical protein
MLIFLLCAKVRHNVFVTRFFAHYILMFYIIAKRIDNKVRFSCDLKSNLHQICADVELLMTSVEESALFLREIVYN